MSEQALNLRRSAQIVRRHRILVGVVTALGLLLGAAYSVLTPLKLTSTALVVLPEAVQSAASTAGSGNTTTNTGPDSYMAAQVVIASSDPVLSGALPNVHPALSLGALRTKVKVTTPAVGILSFSAQWPDRCAGRGHRQRRRQELHRPEQFCECPGRARAGART